MRWLLFLLIPGVLLAQSEAAEEMHGAVGASFSLSPRDQRLGTGWITSFGSRLWLTERMGLRSDLSYQRSGLSDQLRRQMPSGIGGYTEILSLHIDGVFRQASGFYVQAGLGVYHRAAMPTSGDTSLDTPRTTKGGWNAGLGWEGRGGFFVEFQYHRIYTPAGATDLLPLVVGTHF